MKQLVGYLIEHKALGIILLAALIFAGYRAVPRLDFELRGSGTTPLDPALEPPLIGLQSEIHSTIKSYSQPGEASQPGPSKFTTSTPGPWLEVITTLGQYCQDGDSYTNLKINALNTTDIDWSSIEGLTTFEYGRRTINITTPQGADLVIQSPSSSNATIDMTCVLLKSERHGALLNCTGPQNSTVRILVGDTPVDVWFMSCESRDKESESDRECTPSGCP